MSTPGGADWIAEGYATREALADVYGPQEATWADVRAQGEATDVLEAAGAPASVVDRSADLYDATVRSACVADQHRITGEPRAHLLAEMDGMQVATFGGQEAPDREAGQ